MTYLFSHSFVSYYWMETCQKYLHFDYTRPDEIASILNAALYDQQEKMFDLLAMVSRHRGVNLPSDPEWKAKYQE